MIKKYDEMIITTKEQHEKLCDDHKGLRMLTYTVFGEFTEGEDAWHISVIEVERAIKDEDAIVSFKKKENEKTMKRYGYKPYKDID